MCCYSSHDLYRLCHQFRRGSKNTKYLGTLHPRKSRHQNCEQEKRGAVRCPFPIRLGGLGERRELPQRGLRSSSDRKRILAHFEGHRTLLFAPIWWCFESHLGPMPRFGGSCPLSQRKTTPGDQLAFLVMSQWRTSTYEYSYKRTKKPVTHISWQFRRIQACKCGRNCDGHLSARWWNRRQLVTRQRQGRFYVGFMPWGSSDDHRQRLTCHPSDRLLDTVL